ncbi:liprin-alpha-2 [Trichonephila clavipes]|nr:liprin-alpha-2 [Trichonephila clavipes]
MITNFCVPELNNHDVQELWFQEDGATCHTARATIDLLKDTFGDRLISRFGPVNWPSRSCDLTPLDYFLRGYVKSLVYADKPQTLDHLEDNIRRVIADIRPQMLEKVIENWKSRLDYIRASRGDHMPEIIFKMRGSGGEGNILQSPAPVVSAATAHKIFGPTDLTNTYSMCTRREFASLTKELNQSRELLLEKEEEIQELKAERNNTRLLLEHLECLVSRHERSLRMTVVKRQAQSPAGVSSEVEVLKALKSLFEHHKALDEKVREKLRVAIERVVALEEIVSQQNEELNQYKSLGFIRRDDMKMKGENGADNSKIANGNLDVGVEASKVIELQDLVEKQANEIVVGRNKLLDFSGKMRELEESMNSAQKEVSHLQQENSILSRDLRENNAQKEDQEERITTLEKRYLNAQRESTTLHDLNAKLEQELANKEAHLKLSEEKIKALQERLELAEQKLTQFSMRSESPNDLSEEAKSKLDALNQIHERQGSVEERLLRLEQQLEEKSIELSRARQREKMNEEHNQRLAATVDKLLAESNDRLQMHLKEKMHSLEEKNNLAQNLDRTQKLLEDTQSEKDKIIADLGKMRSEMDSLRHEFQNYKSDSLSRFILTLGARYNTGLRTCPTGDELCFYTLRNIREIPSMHSKE